MRLGQEAGLDQETLAALYYALLLKDAGCSSNAARMAALFGSDDQTVKPRMKVVDWDDRVRLAVETWRASGLSASLWSRMQHFVGIARQERMTEELIAARCERGADIAARLGFPEATAVAIRFLDLHWNGKGYPQGLRHAEIPLLSRILNIAQTVEVFLARDGVRAALGVLRERRGRWFDPALVDEVLSWQWDDTWWAGVAAPDVDAQVVELEPAAAPRRLGTQDVDEVAAAFAEIIDAKSPFTSRHSSNVAMYACAIGETMGFDADALRRTRLAALLHDVGKLGVSNRILDKDGPLDAAERGSVERHPLFTWDILSRVEAFAPFARQAATHHEKLDGSGYPWKLEGDDLDLPSRVLVVADIYEAVTATRPYRKGLPAPAAIAILQQHRGTKLDPDAIDALASHVLEPVAEHLAEEL
jgi:HD-GYP domain-containing protein (c-di-GMP phosphodiesterase class II)